MPGAALPEGGVVLDAVYEPPRTRLLAEAEARGNTAIGGKWMLVEQAREQIRLWAGRDAPADVMSQAFERAGPRGEG